MPNITDVGNKGLYLTVNINDSNLVMRDSALFSFTLTNPQNDSVKLDRTIIICLAHHCFYNTLTCYIPIERINYNIYRGPCDTIIRPKEQQVINVMTYIKPEFFYYGDNDIYAEVICGNYYDEKQKKIIRAKHKLLVYSNPIHFYIGKESEQSSDSADNSSTSFLPYKFEQ